ncbi:GNAT family N-acetyltransferase [Sulfitobacter albidus]|uniref:GNAT family N-acetyltransferase n=1 Tax=Sulfitobacter albidus TaxID=2829501 RepID=A0A975JBF5_9RHOB|nr:GNAT family N-acetyltransferase [Sulfitobacter albidus]QUJ75175.1 GNAT family N-acetyltransferase [Sulfitobacter albidus]
MTKTDLRPFTGQDLDWLVAPHVEHYAAEEGFDASFGDLVAEILDAFIADHDPQDEAGWIAWQDGQRLGSIFCVRLDERRAKLRLFLLMPKARGQGLGRRLLEVCTDFARAKGYTGMQLWTHESHAAACALYRRNGWRMTEERAVTSFGRALIEQTYRIDF